MKIPRVQFCAAAALAASLLTMAIAAPPLWWEHQSVLTGTAANDYAAVNQGQVKAIAYKAYLEFQERLPGGAGTALDTLITSWTQPPPAGVVRQDYAAINQGQLKSVVKLFYSRLAELGYHGQPLTTGHVYPWTTVTTDDTSYAGANIGQVKYLFSFDLNALLATADDTDGNGLPDSWEIQYFGHIGANPYDDPDHDGLTNLEEFIHGSNPLSADTDGDGMTDGTEVGLGRSAFSAMDRFGLPSNVDVVLVLPGSTYLGFKRSTWTLTTVTPTVPTPP